MSGSWVQAWQTFMMAMAGMSAPSQIAVWVGSALVLVMAVEGLLVSFRPQMVFRRMRLLPPAPPRDEDTVPSLHHDMRVEPSFPAPAVQAPARRFAPRVRPRPSLKIVGKNAPEN